MNKKEFIEDLNKFLVNNKNVVILHADHNIFKKIIDPDIVYDCGISEQAMIGVAAGIAHSGLLPVVCARTPFIIERCYEQLKLDVRDREIIFILDSSRSEWGITHTSYTHLSHFDNIITVLGLTNRPIGKSCFLEVE